MRAPNPSDHINDVSSTTEALGQNHGQKRTSFNLGSAADLPWQPWHAYCASLSALQAHPCQLSLDSGNLTLGR
jgi:hypothetical protein